MGRRFITSQRRDELTEELCEPDNYMLYYCISKEEQKARVRRAKANAGARQRKAQTADLPDNRIGTPKRVQSAPAAVGVPLRAMKNLKEDLKDIKAKASAARKLPDQKKEQAAQTVSSEVAREITKLETIDRQSKKRSATTDDLIDGMLTKSGLRGESKKRAKSLVASKGVRKINQIVQ